MQKDFCLDHHPVAAIVYCRRRHVINLFIWRSRMVESATAEIVTTHDG